jgi:hypothetical protein
MTSNEIHYNPATSTLSVVDLALNKSEAHNMLLYRLYWEIPYIRVFFFACRKFCEKRVNLYISYLAEVIFCDLKQYIRIFMAHNHEHNFYVFYFWRIKNGCEKCEN